MKNLGDNISLLALALPQLALSEKNCNLWEESIQLLQLPI